MANALRTLGFRDGVATLLRVIGAKYLHIPGMLDISVLEKWRLAKLGAKVIDKNTIMFLGRRFEIPPDSLEEVEFILYELFHGVYDFARHHETIVDIGGFTGESAWYFLVKRKARKVIVYEPVYYDLCKKNIGDVALVYPYAIHNRRGTIRLRKQGGRSHVAGGSTSDYGEIVEAMTITFSDVLSELQGDVGMKIDCEGCEEYLTEVPCSLLRRVSEYIVEVHKWVDIKKLVNHFKSCRFSSLVRKLYDENSLMLYARLH